jgi:hypothetical protein
VSKYYDTYIDANPHGKDRVGGIPLRESGSLHALQVQVDLINKREHGRCKWRDKLCIGSCATAREVVRVNWAGVELRDVIADPVRASRSRPARECRVTERVGRRRQTESWVEAGL